MSKQVISCSIDKEQAELFIKITEDLDISQSALLREMVSEFLRNNFKEKFGNLVKTNYVEVWKKKQNACPKGKKGKK